MKLLPNILTVSRFILALGFLFFIMQDGVKATIIATVFFALASLTDFFDGYLARKYDVISNFGKIMDPIADKFLILSAFAVFFSDHIISLWVFVVIAAREILVTIFRFWAMRNGHVLAAENGGKIKTVLQIVFIFVQLTLIMLHETNVIMLWECEVRSLMWVAVDVLIFAVVAFTLISGFFAFWNNRKLFLKG